MSVHTSDPSVRRWAPSRRTLWAIAGVTALVGLASALLTVGVEGEPFVQYISTPEDSPSDQVVEYAAKVGIDPAVVSLDRDAAAELERRGVNPCPAVGQPSVPADLAARVPIECNKVDSVGPALPFVVALLGVAVLGVIIVLTSGNMVGFYLLLAVFFLALTGAGEIYTLRALQLRRGSLPLGHVAGYVAATAWIPVAVIIVPRLLATFPTGHLRSRIWRWVPWSTYVAAVAMAVALVFHPVPGESFVNPLPSLPGADALFVSGLAIWFAGGIAGGLMALLVRFARAEGEERLQLKWVALAAAVALSLFVVELLFSAVPTALIQGVAFVLLPAAALASIFKYRLYDIDRIINRVVVYGAVTFLLATIFTALVVLPQAILAGPSNAGGLELFTVVGVAVPTLVVAAAFNPLRRRVQSLVDRRFNRSRYDSERVVERFGARLREPRDLEALVADVSRVVTRALAPRRIGVWTAEGDRDEA